MTSQTTIQKLEAVQRAKGIVPNTQSLNEGMKIHTSLLQELKYEIEFRRIRRFNNMFLDKF